MLSRAIAPPQDLATGVLTIVVIEGYIEQVVFAGPGAEAEPLSRYADALTSERPLRSATLERTILLIDDLPGTTVEAELNPVDEASGIYELTLQVNVDAVDGFGSLDNRGTEGVGPLEAWVGAGLNSWFGARERLQASVFAVPNDPHELTYTDLTYDQPIGFDGALLSFSGYASWVNESLPTPFPG